MDKKGLMYQDGTRAHLQIGDMLIFRKSDNSCQLIGSKGQVTSGNLKMPYNLPHCSNNDDRMFGSYIRGLKTLDVEDLALLVSAILAMAGIMSQMKDEAHGRLVLVITEVGDEKINPELLQRMMEILLPPETPVELTLLGFSPMLIK